MRNSGYEDLVRSRYSSQAQVAHYRNRAAQGLRKWEQTILNRYLGPTEILTIGCGGGRESFALEKLGYKVTGIDIYAS